MAEKGIPIMVLLIYFNFVQNVNSTIQCSSVPSCRCRPVTVDKYMADCSKLSLTSVPEFYSNVVKVDLSHNSISRFPENGKFPEQLDLLDFSHNKISTFQNDSFQNLSSLNYLNLSSNSLCLNNKTFFPGVFKGLTNLVTLNLKNNCIHQSEDQYYPADAFSTLESLQELYIDGLNIREFNVAFSELKQLKRLDVSGLTGKCLISYMTPRSFKYLPHLENIDISGCEILRIENGTFRTLSNLSHLDISFNKDLTFRVLSNVSFDLQQTAIKVLKANKIYRTFGLGTEVFVDDLKFLEYTALEELYLDSNRLQVIESGVFRRLPKTLIRASLADNKFTMGQYIFEVFQVSNVKNLNASFQHISHSPADLNPPPPKESCDQQVRKLCPGEKNSQTSLSSLTIPSVSSDNERSYNVQSIIQRALVGKYGAIPAPFPPNLEKFYFTKCALRYSIPALNFFSNKIKYADLSGNILSEWIGPVKYLDHLEYIDLSNNYCSNVSISFFCCVKKLETLLIGNNYLGFVLNKDLEGNTFHRLVNLKKLDISLNRIQELQPNIFRGLDKLRYLNISNNALRLWTFEIRHMKHLKHIDFSNNELTDLNKYIRDDLDEMAKGDLKIDLQNNNFLCNCDTLDFLTWLTKTKLKFQKFDTYSCTKTDGSSIQLKNLGNIISELNFKCNIKWILIISCSVVGSAVIVLFTGITVYLCRWKLRVWYYSLKLKRNRGSSDNTGYRRVPENGTENDFRFDVFFIYDDEDLRFVWTAMEKLEATNKRICCRERDFIIGSSDYKSICQALQQSRKIVIVLSPSLLESDICTFQRELAMTESQCRKNGPELFLVLNHREVDAGKIPLDILNLMRHNLFIECPSDHEENDIYWQMVSDRVS